VSVKERQYPIIEKISLGNRRLGAVELGKGHLGVGMKKKVCWWIRPTPFNVPT
jgi:hypothetical protein